MFENAGFDKCRPGLQTAGAVIESRVGGWRREDQMTVKDQCYGLVVLVALGGLAGDLRAQTPEQFYAGKSVAMIIGFDVGGSLDVYGRLAARHLGNHIPGHPAIVPQNMPGASGLAYPPPSCTSIPIQ